MQKLNLIFVILIVSLTACNLNKAPESTATDEAPPVLPIPAFQQYIGMGYFFVTTEQIGEIPADSLVRIGSAQLNNEEWIYNIANEGDTLFADARESQLTYAPYVTPGAPTPTAGFHGYMGMNNYPALTKEQIGDIPANTRVRVSVGHFDGREWIYQVVMENETTFAEARQSQLEFAAGFPPEGIPTPTIHVIPSPTPTQ